MSATKKFWAYNVRDCSRCGGNHRRVAAREFRRPPKDWSAWALCPKTGEPILLAFGPPPAKGPPDYQLASEVRR